jgi:hypothetical protein
MQLSVGCDKVTRCRSKSSPVGGCRGREGKWGSWDQEGGGEGRSGGDSARPLSLLRSCLPQSTAPHMNRFFVLGKLRISSRRDQNARVRKSVQTLLLEFSKDSSFLH